VEVRKPLEGLVDSPVSSAAGKSSPETRLAPPAAPVALSAAAIYAGAAAAA
jgi:hypothetical protein